MSHSCGACDGSGECQNEHHDFFDAMMSAMGGGMMANGNCPACGQIAAEPGNCSVCGGSGEQDDDDDW